MVLWVMYLGEISPLCCLQSHLMLLQRLTSCTAIWQCHCFQKLLSNQQSEFITFQPLWSQFLVQGIGVEKGKVKYIESNALYALTQHLISIRKEASCWYILSTPTNLLLYTMTTSGLTVTVPCFFPLLFAYVCHTNFIINCGQETNQFLTLPPLDTILWMYRAIVSSSCSLWVFMSSGIFFIFNPKVPITLLRRTMETAGEEYNWSMYNV